MKEFYENMLRRWLSIRDWRDWGMTPLENVVWQECREKGDARRVHDHEIRLLLKEIARLEAEAKKYGEGEQDWMVSSFHHMLENARNLDESDPRTLTPTELSRQRRAMRYKMAAAVYPLRGQGLSLEEIASELGISEEAVLEAERKLIRLFWLTMRQPERHSRYFQMPPVIQTMVTLRKSAYRVFRRKTETGVQYRFYCRDRLLGTGSAGPMAEGHLVLWHNALMFTSSFDPGHTIFPGLSRTVVDGDNPVAEAARLTYLEAGRYELRLNWDTGPVTIRIESEGETTRFYQDDKLIGEILPLQQPQQMDAWEIDFCMESQEPLPDGTALMLMSFPMLRFAL